VRAIRSPAEETIAVPPPDADRLEPAAAADGASGLDGTIHRAIGRAAGFLLAAQRPDGGFRCLRCRDPELASGEPFGCHFTTALALGALGLTGDPRVEPARARAADRLLAEMEAGTWRFSDRADRHRYPPDLDDTALISHVLEGWLAGRTDATGEVRGALGGILAANRALIAEHRDGRGRFLTWFRGHGAGDEVDSVVNANVVLYLGDGEVAAAACDWLLEIVEAGDEESTYWYYLDPLALYAALARAIAAGAGPLAPASPAVAERVRARRRPDGSFGSPLATALAISTLALLDRADPGTVAIAAAYLAAAQRPDGSWPREAFTAGPPPPSPRSFWFGSEEETTALCLDALARLARRSRGSRGSG
jgi:hypothetical protein